MTAFVFNTSCFLLLAIFDYYAINHLNFSAFAVGAALGTYGAGMVAGAFVYPSIAVRMKFQWQIMMGPICAACAAFFVAATLLLPQRIAAAIVFVAFFLFGCGLLCGRLLPHHYGKWLLLLA